MPPSTYLEQHIKSIEDKKKEYTYQLFFRDPKYYTYTYTFTLKNIKGKEFYNKKVLTRDNYQLGYHRALIYRENCYSCNYARKERISDLTIGDFSGLGRFAPFEYDKHNVSCILENTDKGAALLKNLKGALSMYERPACEAFEVEKQLKSPSVKHVNRDVFEVEYKKRKNFENAANASLRQEKSKAIQEKYLALVKSVIRNVLPKKTLLLVKQILNR